MKVKYVGKSFFAGLTNGKTYECVGIVGSMLRIIDDTEDDYLYSASKPRDSENPNLYGKWIIIEDDDNNSLYRVINGESFPIPIAD